MTALMTCLILISTMFFKIPIPATQGYVHPGDAMIFLSILILGIKYGTAAAAVGSALGDILGGFAAWAPWTLGIKGGMALIAGAFAVIAFSRRSKNFCGIPFLYYIGIILGGAFMTLGYWLAEGFMYGNYTAAALGIPWNIAQFAVGAVICTAVFNILSKSPAGKILAYK